MHVTKTTQPKPRQPKRAPQGEANSAPTAPEVGQPKNPAQRRAVVEAALARKKATTPAKPKPSAEDVIREMRAKQGLPALPEPSKAPTSKAPDQRSKGLELCQRIHQWFNGKDKDGKKRTFPQLEQAYAGCNPSYLKNPKAARAPLALDSVNANLKHGQDSLKIKAELGKLRAALTDALKAARAIDDLHPFQWGTLPSQEIVQFLGFASTWTDEGLSLKFPSPPKRGAHDAVSTLVAAELKKRGEKDNDNVVKALKNLDLVGDDYTSVTLQKTLAKKRERKAAEETRQRKTSKKKRRQRKPGK